MYPRRGERVAFVRVRSGRLENDMWEKHARTGKAIRISGPQKVLGQDRAVVEDAYTVDVIGLNNLGMFSIGDTLDVGSKVEYEGIPRFSREIFSRMCNPNRSAFKKFSKGVTELREEGAVQILYDTDESKRDPIVAAVGQVQLEVVQHRLENEYGVETRLEPMGLQVARWITGGWFELEKVGRDCEWQGRG
jgi:Peptide chain release factor RF-3